MKKDGKKKPFPVGKGPQRPWELSANKRYSSSPTSIIRWLISTTTRSSLRLRTTNEKLEKMLNIEKIDFVLL